MTVKIPLRLGRSKYRAVPTIVDGIRFASKKEANRYGELKLLEQAGKISVFRSQEKFPLIVRGQTIGHYVADFTFYEHLDRGFIQFRVEDVKGFRTPLYRWKKKHFEAQYEIEIREV